MRVELFRFRDFGFMRDFCAGLFVVLGVFGFWVVIDLMFFFRAWGF